MVFPQPTRIQRPRLGSSAANNPRLDYSRARTRSFPGPRPAEQRRGVLSHARLCGDDPVVRRISFDSFLIGESQRREKPDHDMGGGKCLLEQAMLVGERWHGRPLVAHMGDAGGVRMFR